MTREEYYAETIRESAEEVGVAMGYEQAKEIASGVLGAIENESLAFHVPENPLENEVRDLKRKFETEKSLVHCKICNGKGRISSCGPSFTADMECYKCGGAGRHKP